MLRPTTFVRLLGCCLHDAGERLAQAKEVDPGKPHRLVADQCADKRESIRLPELFRMSHIMKADQRI